MERDQRESKQALQGKTDQEAKESPQIIPRSFPPHNSCYRLFEVGNALREDPQSRNNRELSKPVEGLVKTLEIICATRPI